MFAPDLKFEKAVKFSRFDTEHPLNTSESHEVELEGRTWASPEHYLYRQLTDSTMLSKRIEELSSAQLVYKLMRPWYRSKKSGWKSLRRVMMTRALYIKVQMYPEIAEYLIGTGDSLIVETSAYDHYWGIGRDQRGENMLGQIWMDIREKLITDSSVSE